MQSNSLQYLCSKTGIGYVVKIEKGKRKFLADSACTKRFINKRQAGFLALSTFNSIIARVVTD